MANAAKPSVTGPAQTNSFPKKRIGDLLIEKGLVTEDQIKIALLEQRKSKKAIGQCLVDIGFITEAMMRDALGEAFGKSSIDLTTIIPDDEAIAFIPKEIALRYLVVPVNYDRQQHQLTIAMVDVHDVTIVDRIQAIVDSKLSLVPVLAAESDLLQAIDNFYGYKLSIDGIIHELETGEVDYGSFSVDGNTEYSHPMVRLVNAILADAVKHGASDIHFEPEENFLRLRYRIDGVLRQIRVLHRDYWRAMVVRLKVISGMNIAETRAPQDGHISLEVSGKHIDFRVSAQPTTHGENVVLRVLDRDKGIVPLEKLDLMPRTLQELKLMMARPEGIILVTGPTGSGKTTTLYSMLNYRNSPDVNIMTLEDPVEYPLPMIRQSSISEGAKLTFATGIRSLMRQDPDIILVGEIRDEDTAEMAFRAAMTGHQVFTTLHTNSAFGALPRLLDIGVKTTVLSGNIIGILAQRLVRKLCDQCKNPYSPDDVEKMILGEDYRVGMQLYGPQGCEACENFGYKGRCSLVEILRFDEVLDDMVARNCTLKDIKAYAVDQGFQSMATDGVRRVVAGETTLEEVARVANLAERIKL
jgi:type II secretory ATPase GspE/PulE/Tfp pilus assembly ATPase PilB-like protein